jgi:hypothetical protein
MTTSMEDLAKRLNRLADLLCDYLGTIGGGGTMDCGNLGVGSGGNALATIDDDDVITAFNGSGRRGGGHRRICILIGSGRRVKL